MHLSKRHKRQKTLLVIGLVASFSLAAAQDAKPPDSTNAQRAESDPKPPTHPVTEEQLRAYFAVCHIATVNRPLIHEKLEAQRRQLPEWCPRTVWDEIEKAIEAIGLPWVAGVSK